MGSDLKIIGLLTVAAPALCGCGDNGVRDANLLVIVVDQLRYDALGVSGNKIVRTPNIDRLASEGAYFTHAYSQCAVSGPGRASLLTGMMVEHHGVLDNELVMADPASYSLTDSLSYDMVLAGMGYYSEYHGNYHSPIIWADCYRNFEWSPLNEDRPYSYLTAENRTYREHMRSRYPEKDVPEGMFYENSNNVGPYEADPLDGRLRFGRGAKVTRADIHGELEVKEDETLAAFYAEEGKKAIRRAAGSGKPFNITISFFNPHPPVLPIRKYRDMYDVNAMPVPASISDPMTDSPYLATNGRLEHREYSDPEMVRYMTRNYYACVSEVDRYVGDILDELEKSGLEKNTMVVFVSDHGELLGSHGMRGKDVFYEEASRIPLIIRYPGHILPCRVDAPVSYMDLFPTLMDYLETGHGGGRDGKSLRPLIEGGVDGGALVTEWLYRETDEPSHMIVKDGWKLILNYSPESKVKPALYDLTGDPFETVNLLGIHGSIQEGHISKAKSLLDELVRYLERHDSGYASQLRNLDI